MLLKNPTIVVPLKYLSNFWRSLEILLFNCKVELKIWWTKYCVLSVAGTDNANGNNDGNNIKDTKLYVLVVTLSARDNKKSWKPLSKRFERSVYWNNYKTKAKAIQQIEFVGQLKKLDNTNANAESLSI